MGNEQNGNNINRVSIGSFFNSSARNIAMETKWRLFEPWWRELRGIVEAVPVEASNLGGHSALNGRFDNLWMLRVILPRPTLFTLSRLGQTDPAVEKDMKKLRAIREALDLLWLVHCLDEKTWTWILVHRCGVGGFELPSWTDDAKILPLIRIQPFYANVIDELLESLDQCHHLLVSLHHDSRRSDKFLSAQQELKMILGYTGEMPRYSYSVVISNWISPQTQLSAADSNSLWSKLSLFASTVSLNLEGSSGFQWQLQSLDVHLSRMVLTFEVSLAMLKLINSRIRINELWIDMVGRDEDEFTTYGFSAVLSMLFSSESSPRTLRVNCENSSLPRLQTLVQVLKASKPPENMIFERFGLSSHSRKASDRAELFSCLGEFLQLSMKVLELDIPELMLGDVSSITAVIKNVQHKSCVPEFLSLVVTVDCHRESWRAVSKLVSMIGSNIHDLAIEINGESLPDTAPRFFLDSCPHLKHLKLHRLQLHSTNPFVDYEPASRLKSLSLPRLYAPLIAISQFSRSIANERGTKILERLDLDLSEIPDICDEIIDGFTSALRDNLYLTNLTLTLDTEAAASISDRVHDDFHHLHNQRLVQPLRVCQKLAFLSVLATRASSLHLSQLPVSIIFEYATSQTCRRVYLREPGTSW